LLKHLACFCSSFPKFKTKLYTDKLLSQVSSHRSESWDMYAWRKYHEKKNLLAQFVHKLRISNMSVPLGTASEEWDCTLKHVERVPANYLHPQT
jgi:hypothetical protein